MLMCDLHTVKSKMFSNTLGCMDQMGKLLLDIIDVKIVITILLVIF